MFEIFVDSAANIPAELVKAFKIKVLSFVNLVNGKEMTCFDPDLTPEEERQKGKDYYDMVRAGAEVVGGVDETTDFDAFLDFFHDVEGVFVSVCVGDSDDLFFRFYDVVTDEGD